MRPKSQVIRIRINSGKLRLLLVASHLIFFTHAVAYGGSWVGNTIVPINSKVRLVSKVDKEKRLEILDMSYRGLQEQHGWVRVNSQGGVEGWLRKTDAIHVEDIFG